MIHLLIAMAVIVAAFCVLVALDNQDPWGVL